LTSSHATHRLCTLLAVTGIVILNLRRWLLLGSYPPGLDGAQWIALGRGWHGPGRSTEGAYAPLVPLLATAADALLGPLPAIRLIAVLSGLSLGLAVWLAASTAVGPLWALPIVAIVIPASALAEPQFYGGYPQQFALAAGIVAISATCRYLSMARLGDLRLLGVMAFITAAAHHIYFPLLVLSITFAVAFRRSTGDPALRPRAVLPVLMVLVPSIALFAAVAISLLSAGYAAPLQASSRSAAEAWLYATREAPAIWTLLLVAAIITLTATWRSRVDIAWLVPASLMIPSGALGLLSGQPRLFPPLIVGAALAAGLGAQRLARAAPSTQPALALVALSLALMLANPADRAAANFAHFYQVLDPSLVRAADAVRAEGAVGRIAVRHDRRGWPIGWWFEAFLDGPLIVGSDRQWLAFPDEWANADLANKMFDGTLHASSFRNLAEAENITHLITPKWDWIGWERWLNDPEFPVSIVYDDDRFLVLRVK
jgi:hypothetical protein